MSLSPVHLDELRALLGADGVLAGEAARFTYEADALALEKHRPDVVVLPRTTDVDPQMDPLRSDPRYDALLRRLGFAS